MLKMDPRAFHALLNNAHTNPMNQVLLLEIQFY